MVTVPEVTYNRAIIAANKWREIVEMLLKSAEYRPKVAKDYIGYDDYEVMRQIRNFEAETFKEHEKKLIAEYEKAQEKEAADETF